MHIEICADRPEIGQRIAQITADSLKDAIASKGKANIVLATGMSQFEPLAELIQAPDIDWSVVTMFHLDEYIGLPVNHPAAFTTFLTERFSNHVSLKAAEFIRGNGPDPLAECTRLGDLLATHPIDVTLAGIGINGHLAFNDPPADFETEDPYLVVTLDDVCRQQQVGEGWFATIDDVPPTAISMSIRQMLKTGKLLLACPGEHKAPAVQSTVEGELTNMCPASIVREHPDCHLFLDAAAASTLNRESV